MLKLEHIGIAVSNLSTSVPLFEKLLNSQCYKKEKVDSENVVTAFFRAGDCKVELLEGTVPEGVIAKFISRKGEGLHHVAFEVEDIYEEVNRLRKEGYLLLSEEPKVGADNKLVVFLHPKSSGGVLVELVQEIKSEK
jgi:methylmalonyl-CoA/ethylmalonyl-CoA epimerase